MRSMADQTERDRKSTRSEDGAISASNYLLFAYRLRNQPNG